MNCQEVIELMQRSVDGDLNDLESSVMMDHVASCPECAQILVRLRQLSGDLAQLPRVVPRYSLVDAIMPELDRLAAQGDGPASGRSETGPPPPVDHSPRSRRTGTGRLTYWRRLAGVAAAGVVVVALVYNMPQFGRSLNDADTAMPMEQAAAGEAADARSMKSEDTGSNSIMMTEEMPAPSSAAALSGGGGADGEAPVSEQAGAPQQQEDDVVTLTGDQNDQSGNELYSADDTVSGGQSEAGSGAGGEPPVDVSASKPLAAKAAAFDVASPDGAWRAVANAEDGVVQVFRVSDETEVFRSERHEGPVTMLEWNKESTELLFTFAGTTGDDGSPLVYRYDTATGTASAP